MPSTDVQRHPRGGGNAASWQECSAPRAAAATGVWSPLEYGCHVRDVFRLYERRLQLMLAEEDPLFANWDQDATAVAWRPSCSRRPPSWRRRGHGGRQWNRPGRRSDGAAFSVLRSGVYLVHDPVHHLAE